MAEEPAADVTTTAPPSQVSVEGDQESGTSPISSKIDLVIQQLSEMKSAANRKDRYDKINVLGTIFIAFVAVFFSWLNSHRDSLQRVTLHQSELAQRDRAQAENLKIQELQIFLAFLPHLTGRDEKKKELAVRALGQLTNPGLAAIFAGIEPSPGTAAGLNNVRRSPNLQPQERARIDTVLQTFPPVSRSILDIVDVPGGGVHPDTVFLTDTVPSAPPTRERRGGTGLCGLWRDSAGNYYCGGPCVAGQTCGRVTVVAP